MNASMLVWGFVRPRTPPHYFPTTVDRKTFVNNLLKTASSTPRSVHTSIQLVLEKSAAEALIDPMKFREVFTADLPQLQSDVLALSQRPIALGAFTEKNGPPAWKHLPSWAAVGTADKAAGTDVVRSMAQRAGAHITEIVGSHVIMISQPDAVLQVILTALADVSGQTLAAPVSA